MFNLIQGMVDRRQGTVMASDPSSVIPAVNQGPFEDMLSDELTFSPHHQSQHVKFAGTVQGGLT